MESKLPMSQEEILATGHIDPDFEIVLEENPMPTGKDYTIEILKTFAEYGLHRVQKEMKTSQISDVVETEKLITLPNADFKSRTIVCSPSDKSKTGPLIVLFYGGGHCIGIPEHQLPLARRLVQTYKATVILPSYRLAPENPSPQSFLDSWKLLKIIAAESLLTKSVIFDRPVASQDGFIIGGESAGAAIAASLAHLARDQNLVPSLTGQYLSAGSFISEFHVPDKYKHRYLSRQQNKNAPLLDTDLWNIFRDAAKHDQTLPLCVSFDQHSSLDAPGEVKQGHMNLPPAYFQVCGLDISRDDSLIYEHVLREECGIPTKAHLYSGYPHCWWMMPPFANLLMTKKRTEDTVEGFGWLLQLSNKQ